MNHLSIKTPQGGPASPPVSVGRQMPRALPAWTIGLACLLAVLGVAQFASGQLEAGPPGAAHCPLRAERFFVREAVASQGRMEASYFVVLRNPGPQARAYGLHFDHAAAFDARSGARATLPGDASLPVLLGRETLPPGAQPLPADRIAEAMRLSCRR